MVAFPPPPVTLRQRSSTFVEPLCSLRRVLASGCHSFLFEWLEKVSQPSLAEPFGSEKGVNRINSRLSLLSIGCHHHDCRPFLGLEGRNLRDGSFIPEKVFLSKLLCVLFSTQLGATALGFLVQRRFCSALLSFLPRLYISFAARKSLSSRLFCDAARRARASEEHSG